MLAMWVFVALRQIDRLDDAAGRYRAAEADGLLREAFEKAGRPNEWKETSSGASSGISIGEYWQMGAERYFLIHALAQVRKCVLRLPDDGLPAVRDMKVLRLLRDIDEHWEQVEEGRSLAEMRQIDNTVRAGMICYNNKHIWIGDVSTGELASWLFELDRAARDRAAAAGSPIIASDAVVEFRSSTSEAES